MAAKKKEVARVSQKELSMAVNKAVVLATRRHRLKLAPNVFDRDMFETPPWIFDRILRDGADLDQAYKAAQTISSNVKISGLDLQPVALRVRDDILVGFIEQFKSRVEISDFLTGDEF